MRILIIVSLLFFASCASYVPATETKAKKVIRKLDRNIKADTERIKAISVAYNLATIVPSTVKGKVALPEIKIEAPIYRNIIANPAVDELLDRYEDKVNQLQSLSDVREEEKQRLRNELEEIKIIVRAMTFDKQEFSYIDENIQANFILDPKLPQPFIFEYLILPQEKEVEIPADTIVVDAGKDYYQFWQFWVLLILFILTVGYFIFTIVKARN